MTGPALLRPAEWTPASVALVVALAALAVRLPLVLALPVVSPDGEAAARVAANLVAHGCISLSDPATGACVPHWGGNHLPGYPAFIALVWLLAPSSVTAVLAVQSAIVALAIGWLARALALFGESAVLGLAAGLLLALSPVQVAWARFLLPDALSVAAALWLFAQLLLSFRAGSIRLVSVALPILASSLLRLDGFVLAVAAAVAGFCIHSPRVALRRGLIIALIVALPMAALLARNVARGLALVPQTGMLYGDPKPAGYLAWGNTWITSIYQGGAMFYPVSQRVYRDIVIDPDAYASDAERAAVEVLIDRLRVHEGEPFPVDIDRAFADIAAAKRAAAPLHHYAGLPLQRMAVFWLHPFASFGWPLDLAAHLTAQERVALSSAGPGERAAIALRHAGLFAGKGIVFLYRLALVTGLALLLAAAWRRLGPAERGFVTALLSFLLLRTVLLSYQTSIDNRYMVSAMAAAEVLLPLLVWRASPQRVTEMPLGRNRP